MYVCERCLRAIEDHNGEQFCRRARDIPEELIHYGFYNDEGDFVEDKCCDENIVCEFCEEMIPITEAVEIMQRFKYVEKSDGKKTGEELQQYLAFKRRGAKIDSKKKYTRKKKHKNEEEFK